MENDALLYRPFMNIFHQFKDFLDFSMVPMSQKTQENFPGVLLCQSQFQTLVCVAQKMHRVIVKNSTSLKGG